MIKVTNSTGKIRSSKQTYAKKFWREIGKNQAMAKEAPPEGRIEKFWEGIWGEKKLVICLQAGKGTRRKKEKVKEQEWENIELKAALTKYQNWGSSGIEKVPNF